MATARDKDKKDPETQVLDKIAEMSDDDRRIAEPLHALIRASAPELSPKLWYGQPAYARAGKVVVFFRGADHDGEPYFTVGFTQHANLASGDLWATSYALKALGSAESERIVELVRTAVG